MKDFSGLKKNLKKDFTEFNTIKVAVLGDTSTQFLVQALKGTGYDHKLNLDIWEADFNQIDLQVFDNSSELYEFNPEIIIIFQASHVLLIKYNKMPPEVHSSFAELQFDSITNICTTLSSKLNSTDTLNLISLFSNLPKRNM